MATLGSCTATGLVVPAVKEQRPISAIHRSNWSGSGHTVITKVRRHSHVVASKEVLKMWTRKVEGDILKNGPRNEVGPNRLSAERRISRTTCAMLI
jgi:hypothetical protein